jgi:RimJ/RimL family protein N-acetyltransferase
MVWSVDWRTTMTNSGAHAIGIEKINLARFAEFHEAIIESSREWFTWGMIPKFDLTYEELKCMARAFLELWERDDTYMFYIMDLKNDQIVGVVFLNRMNRMHQFANLGYAVRTSCINQGFATAAAKLVARYGFEKLDLQRIEIVASTDNLPSLRVAEKVGAAREGLLRNGLRMHGIPCDAYMHSLIPADLCITKETTCTATNRDASLRLNAFFHRIIKS